uniref:Uncharacterized protein n=1 Tax=Scleropages formosus TaxID=113540 RepID=A0A8C9RIG7_SCLFO
HNSSRRNACSFLRDEGGPMQDNTLQFVFILFLKVILNVLTVVLCSRTLRKSFMGLTAISLFLVDCLLFLGMVIIWLLRHHIKTTDFRCFILAHASTVYAVLPLPVLLLGILDPFGTNPTFKTFIHSMEILVTWSMSCVYSYFITNTAVIEVHYDHIYQLCTMQDSSLVMSFCSGVSLLIVCIVLLCCQEVSSLLKEVFKDTNSSPDPLRTRQPTLLLGLILGFSANWAPFLFINTVCWLLDFNVPSYVSVNILWLLCVNSFIVRTTFFFRREKLSLCFLDADIICDWKPYWKLSHNEPFPPDLCSFTNETKTIILHA